MKEKWWAWELVVMIIIVGCAAPAPQPETTSPAPSERPPAHRRVAPAPSPPPARPSQVEPAPPPVRETAPPVPRVEPKPKETFFTHTVKYSGETVSIIAAWYLGDKMKWEVLAEANPKINPKIIRVGDKILIPESVMVTREPMPKEHVDKFYPAKKEKASPKPEPSETKKEEIELFGPKEHPKK